MDKINKRFLIFALIFVILITTPILLNKYYNYQLQPVSKNNQPQIFIIKPGQDVSQIAKNLEKASLIKNALAFRLLVSQMGISKNIQAGDFRLFPSQSAKEIASQLTHGAIDIWITLPEGLRIEEQAQKIEEALKFGSNEKYQFNKKEYIKLAKEGYMFPDTYLIPKDAAAKDITGRLNETFSQKVSEDLLQKGVKNNLTNEEVVILASLIEKEAKEDLEGPVIAGIILNRLKTDMTLDIDATVSYAKGFDSANDTWWPQISTSDYQNVQSLYNTYLHPGFPPGPIASPGLESIRAAADPAQTEYYFYLPDREGKIHYAVTVDQHNKNIVDYLK